MKQIVYKTDYYRNCPICGSEELEQIQKLVQRRVGIKNEHILEANLSICKICGFVFSNPTLQQAMFDAYYNDQIPYYEVQETYSVENRLKMITEFLSQGKSIVEIGGNQQGAFKDRLEEKGYTYYSYDINIQCANSAKSFEELPKCDMLVSYYVFEHIVDINDFVQRCKGLLRANGVCIIEVPDLRIYDRNIAGLALTEHVNHFTPETLSSLMKNHGFTLLQVNRKYSSRNFGFVGVYKNETVSNAMPVSYILNRSVLLAGLEKINSYARRKEELAIQIENMCSLGGGVAFWCISSIFFELYALFASGDVLETCLLIDEDKRKQEFSLPYRVYTSHEANKEGRWGRIECLIICSEERVESVMRTFLKYKKQNKTKVFCITNEYELRKISCSSSPTIYSVS